MATSMTNGLCLAFTALQIKPDTSNTNRSVLSEIDTKPRARSNSLSNNRHDHHNHNKHKRAHARNSISAEAQSSTTFTSTTTTAKTSSAATTITSSIFAGVVDTVRGIADGISNSIASTTSSVCSKVVVAAGGGEDQENVRPTFSREEVSDHCTPESCWIIVNNKVFDVTRFLAMHPGGEDIILEYGGHDATSGFIDKGHSPDAFEMLGDYCIGEITKAEWYPEKNYT